MNDMADYSQNAQTLIYLLSCAVNEKECELKHGEMDFEGLYSLAAKHGLCSAVAFALESAGIIEHKFEQAKLKAKRKLGLFDIERAKICDKLNMAGIWYLPLKGIVIKDFYPRYGMREMSDNDILCDSSKMPEVRRIMESLGYTCEHYGEWNHDTYQKPPTLEFEMHHSLFWKDEMPVLDRYYENVFDRLMHKCGCEYFFSDEDLYIYIVTHGYKHFSQNGTGLRSLLDIYVFLKTHSELDFEYIEKEFKKLEISHFEQRSRELSLKLFDFQTLNTDDMEFLDYFIDSTLYGSVGRGEYNMLTQQLDGRDTKTAKVKYLLSRIFLHGDTLKKHYPFFAKHKILLPTLYIYRLFRGVFTHPKNIIHETKNVIEYNSPKNRW